MVKEKLTLKELAPYLPYRLKLREQNFTYVLAGFNQNVMLCYENGDPSKEIFDVEIMDKAVKIILRPLSDLTKEITVNEETFVPIVEISKMRSRYLHESEFEIALGRLKMDVLTKRLPYDMMIKLIELHFDVFGLIEKGLAININTLK